MNDMHKWDESLFLGALYEVQLPDATILRGSAYPVTIFEHWDGVMLVDKDVSFAFLPEDVLGVGPTGEVGVERFYIKRDAPKRNVPEEAL
jgi:hypothetical protein